MYQLVPFEFGAFNERLPALCADVYSGPVSVEVFPHGRVVPEHFGAALVGASDRPRYLLHTGLTLGLDPEKQFQSGDDAIACSKVTVILKCVSVKV